MQFSNTYASLDAGFFERTKPEGVRQPTLFLWNAPLAEALMIPADLTQDPLALARLFSGSKLLEGSDPIALAYAGHQFGNFVPQLGDGRAHLLGEVVDRSGQRWDIQLKGSGRTAFSRGGDGRCALGPAIREYIMSAAMEAMGVATTRALAVVLTGESVYRETALPGAVVTRVAESHMRVGTFQYFAARGNQQAVEQLCDYALARHYPHLQSEVPQRFVDFLAAVMEKQIKLVVDWMRVGFIHGVMNTDNTAISGQTIDYGPCAMMGTYDPATVFSSIDSWRRYAFGKQPSIAQWNMARLAECILPLVDPNEETAMNSVVPLIDAFPRRFEEAWQAMMAGKLGLRSVVDGDGELFENFLQQMKKKKLDYTVTFNQLADSLSSKGPGNLGRTEFGPWLNQWQHRMQAEGTPPLDAQQRMRQNNPLVIPRNHHMENVIERCVETGDPTSAEAFLEVLRSPYDSLPHTSRYQDPPADGDRGYQTFCGT